MTAREPVSFTGPSLWLSIHEKYIPEELWEQHKKMCHQYRTARTMDEAESMYHGLRAWWVSAGAVTERALNKLELWLAFWHYRYRQRLPTPEFGPIYAGIYLRGQNFFLLR
jgi:hypothetical protein